MRMPWSSDFDNVKIAEDMWTFSILAMSAADEDALGRFLLYQNISSLTFFADFFYFREDVIGKIEKVLRCLIKR